MSELSNPSPVLIFSSFLYLKTNIESAKLESLWNERYGKSVRFDTSYCPMKNYYSKEMGQASNLERFFMASISPVPRDELVKAKLWAVEIENSFMSYGAHSVDKTNGAREVNLDVGTISLENVQLATGKNFTHRVYISDGIFSDLTLIYQKNSYRKLEWSYPDYSSDEVINFLNWCRSLLHQQSFIA